MRRTKEAAEETRQHILEAAIEVFAENGYTSTRLSDIAAKAKVTRGAIYWHFTDKKHLFIDLIKDRIKPFLIIVEQTVQETTGPLEKIRNIMFKTSTQILENSKFEAFQKLEFVKTGMLQIEDIEYIVSDHFTKVQKLITQLIQEGQASGEIDDAFEPQSIGNHLHIFMRGLGFMLTHPKEKEEIRNSIQKLIDLEIKTIQK